MNGVQGRFFLFIFALLGFGSCSASHYGKRRDLMESRVKADGGVRIQILH